MRKTKGFGQKAFGIASGFERTMPRASNRAGGGEGTPAAPIAPEDDDNIEEYVNHFEDANEKGHVLNKQTFGGQITNDNGKGPSYMLGTFRDSRSPRGMTIVEPD
jgi:DNA-directed RNA polymerase-3 subunit RPC5